MADARVGAAAPFNLCSIVYDPASGESVVNGPGSRHQPHGVLTIWRLIWRRYIGENGAGLRIFDSCVTIISLTLGM